MFLDSKSRSNGLAPNRPDLASRENAKPADPVQCEISVTERLLKGIARLRDRISIARRLGLPLLVRRRRWNAAIRALDRYWMGGYVKTISGDLVYLPAPLDFQAKRFLKGEGRVSSSVLRHLPPGGVAFDVGANLGEWTLAMARAAGAGGRVFAIEPNPAIASALAQTLDINDLQQVELHRCALSSVSGTADFILSADSSGESRLGTALPGERAVSVRTRTLDSMAEQAGITRLDFIKIDVESHEHFVLEGAAKTLSRFQPGIVIESGHESGEDRIAIARLLETAGYVAGAVLVDNGALPVTLADYLNGTGACCGKGSQNIFFLPVSRQRTL